MRDDPVLQSFRWQKLSKKQVKVVYQIRSLIRQPIQMLFGRKVLARAGPQDFKVLLNLFLETFEISSNRVFVLAIRFLFQLDGNYGIEETNNPPKSFVGYSLNGLFKTLV